MKDLVTVALVVLFVCLPTAEEATAQWTGKAGVDAALTVMQQQNDEGKAKDQPEREPVQGIGLPLAFAVLLLAVIVIFGPDFLRNRRKKQSER